MIWATIFVGILAAIMIIMKMCKKDDVSAEEYAEKLKEAVRYIETIYDYVTATPYEFSGVMLRKVGENSFEVVAGYIGDDASTSIVKSMFAHHETSLISSFGNSRNYGNRTVADDLKLKEDAAGLWVVTRFQPLYYSSWRGFCKSVENILREKHPKWKITFVSDSVLRVDH